MFERLWMVRYSRVCVTSGDSSTPHHLLGFFLNSTAGCTPCADRLCDRCTGARGKKCLSCKKVWFGPDDYEEPSRPVYVNATGQCAIW